MSLRRRHVDEDDLDSFGHDAWFDGRLDGPDEFDDGDDEVDGPQDGGALARVGRIAVIVVAVAAVVALAVMAARVLRQPDDGATEAPALSTPPTPSTAASGATAPVGQVAAAPTVTAGPAATAGPVTTTATPSTTAAAARTEVSALQTVPAVRDLVIEINGRRYATAADGSIAIDPADRHGTVTVVGVRAVPALLQATFTNWADGVALPTRPLDEVDGPVAQLGFTLHYRVQVMVGIAGEGTVSFDSVAGPVDIPIGVPTFVPAMRAMRDGSSFTVQSITYQARSIQRGGSAAPVAGAPFTPGPEALWRVLP